MNLEEWQKRQEELYEGFVEQLELYLAHGLEHPDREERVEGDRNSIVTGMVVSWESQRMEGGEIYHSMSYTIPTRNCSLAAALGLARITALKMEDDSIG